MILMRCINKMLLQVISLAIVSSIISPSSLMMISSTSAFTMIPATSPVSLSRSSSISSSVLYYTPPHSVDPSMIRFLGKGPNALVRPGVVLIAPVEEYDHYLMKAAIFVYAMGLDEETDEEIIRCVVLDNPTPFTMAEMSNSAVSGDLGENLLYRGGNAGKDSAIMLHNVTTLEKEEIGTSGIYEGGLEVAAKGAYNVNRFKFFFNYCEFRPEELTNLLDMVDAETGDGWMSVEAPSEVVLHDWDKNDCWRYCRRIVRERFKSNTNNNAVGS